MNKEIVSINNHLFGRILPKEIIVRLDDCEGESHVGEDDDQVNKAKTE